MFYCHCFSLILFWLASFVGKKRSGERNEKSQWSPLFSVKMQCGRAVVFQSVRLIGLESECLGNVYVLVVTSALRVPMFADEDEPKHLSLQRQQLCKMQCSQINFVCVVSL